MFRSTRDIRDHLRKTAEDLAAGRIDDAQAEANIAEARRALRAIRAVLAVRRSATQ